MRDLLKCDDSQSTGLDGAAAGRDESNMNNRDVNLCPLCLAPMLNEQGRAIPCACDEAERRGIRIPDDTRMTSFAYALAVTDYRHRLHEEGLMK